jgi:hydrophobe/amphiphile efflux-1 (HAE1) family protein
VLSAFFIDRPRFAIVISIVITLAGVVSYLTLPVDRFPDLAPPTVQVIATYPGASAEVVEQAVAAPIEEELNGVKNMLYISSVSSNDGVLKIVVTFEVGTDLDLATVQVQNRVQRALPKLPQEVQRQGVTVEESAPNMLMVVNLATDREEYDELFLGNYVTLYLKDSLARIKGIGSVTVFGARDYGMRIWLDPDRLSKLGLTVADVAAAIREQNELIPAGRIGGPPTLPDQRFQLAVSTKGRLSTVKEFENIIVRANPDGSMIRIRDAGRVELGAQNYDASSRLNGEPTATMGLYQLPGSNALEVRTRVIEELDRLSASFPPGLEYVVAYDSTEVIEASMAEVRTTFIEAVLLVVLVVFIFLANFRATVIPGLAVPVSLIGTFALMGVLGFSVNTLSLFGLILAIGIVVDDAIVVVETTVRNIEEGGMAPQEAAKAAMNEVFGAVIASTLVLLAVFVPVSFIPGLTGRLYNQFALTICCAVVISTINAITLSPALSALLLRPSAEPGWLRRSFDRVFNPLRAGYVGFVERAMQLKTAVIVVFVGLLACTYLLLQVVPGGFVPAEDDGVLFFHVQLPDASSLNRTEEILRQLEEIVAQEETVENVIAIAGYNLLSQSNASNAAMVIVKLEDWSQRTESHQKVDAVRKRLQGAVWSIPEASVFVFTPAPIPGLGNTGGSDYVLQDRGSGSAEVLEQMSDQIQSAANAQPAVGGTTTTYRSSVPRVFIDIDRNQAKTLGVSMDSISNVLSTNLGSLYTNDFVRFGRNFRVLMAAERSFTTDPLDIVSLFVENRDGRQVPLGAIANVEKTTGPDSITRFNLFRSATITALPAPGATSGQVIQTMEDVSAAILPPELGYEWQGSAVEEKKAAGASTVVLAFALVLVFLFLVAQYESFSLPISVLAVIPMAALGALLFQLMLGLALDVYCQVGLVLLVGLTAKTAILLVELAKQRMDAGDSAVDAVIEACRLRFRAVLMTASTFLLGMVPLLVSTGAGAAARNSLGSAVFGGTLIGILLALVFVPVFVVLVQNLRTGRR